MSSLNRETPSLFLRNATGLVKGWSGFDAFTYSFMSVNLVTLGMYFSFLYVSSAADGSMISSIVLSGVAVTFLCVAYAGLIAVMPRAGGDYVWQSRVLDGIPGIVSGAVMVGVGGYLVGTAIGGSSLGLIGGIAGIIGGGALGYLKGALAFVLAATGWWFILAQWAPIYGSILRVEFLQPLAALIGWSGGVSFFSTANGSFVTSLIVIALTTALVSLGMAGYARIQRWSLWIGLVGLAIMFILMLVSSQTDFQNAFDKASSSLFGVSGAYNAVVAAGAANGNTSLMPFGIGSGTLTLIPFMMFWILYPNWGATLYGEVRGSGDFKKVLRGMLGGTWVTVILAVVFLALAAKTFGWAFYSSTGAQVYSATPVIPIWGYPPLLVSFLVDNRIFQIGMVVIFGAWFLGWSGTLFLSSTRMIFAAAFDRVLPEAAARVSDRGVPTVALALIMVPSIIVSAIYAYWTPFVQWTLDASLVIAVMFFGTAIAATILPWWKPKIYENSAMARYKLAGIPLISIAGFLTVLVLGWTIYQWLENSIYGIGVGTPSSIIYLGVLYGMAIVVYVAAWLYRRSHGVDLSAIHSEIPSE